MACVASRISRFVIVLVAFLLVAPGAWADPGSSKDDRGGSEGARHDHESGRSQGTTAEEASDESDPEEPQEDPEPSESPRTGPSREETREASGHQEPVSRQGAEGDALDTSFSASPAHIDVGEESALSVTITNNGADAIGSLEVVAGLPPSLDLVSSVPTAARDEGVIRLDLGSLPVGATAGARLIVVGIEAPAPQLPVRFALVADDQIVRHDLTVEVDPAGPPGLELAQSGPLLVQVGDAGEFALTVSNSTDEVLTNLSVVAEIATELDVAGVAPTPEADAVQLGSSAVGEDIVWLFHELQPNETVELAWSALAVAPGDLEATNLISAEVAGRDVASSEQSTYLGFVETPEVESNQAPAPLVRRRVVTKMVPVTKELAGSVGGLLPVTGGSPVMVSGLGGLLIALGLVALWLSGRAPALRRCGVVALSALLLTSVACVSSSDGPSDSSSGISGLSAVERAAGLDEMPKLEDQVLGIQIERDPPAPGATASSTTPEPGVVGGGQMQTETVMQQVVTVESIVVPPPALPVREMSSATGDNIASLTLLPTGELTATSSRAMTFGAQHELLVSVEGSGSRLDATVTLTNLTRTERLAVRGRLVLELAGEGASSTLYSDPIDVVLEPAASVDTGFTFSLPTGSFSAAAGFLND